MAFMCSPAERYICTAAFGSLISLAQSACFFISIFVSLGSPDARNSCNSAIQKSALPSGHKCHYSLNSKTAFVMTIMMPPKHRNTPWRATWTEPAFSSSSSRPHFWEKTMASLPFRQLSIKKKKAGDCGQAQRRTMQMPQGQH